MPAVSRMVAAAALLAAAGCDRGQPPAYTLEGTVGIGADPLEYGVIRFTPEGVGVPVAANVSGGRYRAENLPAGKYRVTVEATTPSAHPGAKASSEDRASTKTRPPVLIPPKYQTGVPVEVAGDDRSRNFDLSQ